MRENIEFVANGTTLRGWLYKDPESSSAQPLVVMAHGFTATKEMTLDRYAELFSAAGLAVLVFDHRNTGASDGLPRFEIDPVAQWRDYSHAITFGQSLKGIDRERIGIWGTSFSGGQVLAVAANDRRVRCVVTQVPMISGYETIMRMAAPADVAGIRQMVDADRTSQLQGNAPGLVPITAADPSQPHVFPGIRSHDYFHGFKESIPGLPWENLITISTVQHLFEYDVTPYIERIAPIPLLMIVAEEDISTPTDIALKAYQRALEPKQLLLVPGDHYGSYIEEFEATSVAARDWFTKHLSG